MSSSLDLIRRRRAQLVASAAVQRDEVTIIFQRLAEPLRMADAAICCIRYLKAHPLVPIVAVVSISVAFALSRYSILQMLQRILLRAFALWRTYRSLGMWVARGQTAWVYIDTMRRNSGRNNLSGARQLRG